jgi:hypothetical protein
MAYHYENNELTDIWAMLSKCSCGVQRVGTQSDFRKDTILGHVNLLIKYSEKIDRTGLKILENYKNM